jgi:AcrR family transcriptional regulator
MARSYAGIVRDGFPMPGSAKARLLAAALHQFEHVGFDATTVADLAAKADVTTGALYHHFGSKLGLYTTVRDDLEQRITDRMEGAAAAIDQRGRAAAGAALLIAFDAAVRFGACRLLGEPAPAERPDPIRDSLEGLLPARARAAAVLLAAAWRAALLEVAHGTPSVATRQALAFVTGE